jgi:hypothetical protein
MREGGPVGQGHPGSGHGGAQPAQLSGRLGLLRVGGNCTAGGFYEDASFGSQPFVVSERNGRWSES